MAERYTDNRNNRNAGKDNPFAGTQYAEQWENNPYANLYYEPTFWDDLGLSNKAKDQNAEYERLYNEYISGLYDQQRQDEYNSESAIADRMRAAGQNPDLLGTSGGSQTGDLTPPSAGPQAALNGQAPAMSGFQMMTQVLGFATSAYQQISSIYGLSLDNLSKEHSIFNSLIPTAERAITSTFATRFASGLHSEKHLHNIDWLNEAQATSPYLYGNKRLHKKYTKAFEHVLNSSWFQQQEQAYKDLDANQRAMKHFIGGYVQMELDALQAKFKSKTSEDNYNTFLFNFRSEFYKNLYQDYKDGSVFAGLLLAGQAEMLNQFVGSAGDVVNTLFDKIPSFKFLKHLGGKKK